MITNQCRHSIIWLIDWLIDCYYHIHVKVSFSCVGHVFVTTYTYWISYKNTAYDHSECFLFTYLIEVKFLSYKTTFQSVPIIGNILNVYYHWHIPDIFQHHQSMWWYFFADFLLILHRRRFIWSLLGNNRNKGDCLNVQGMKEHSYEIYITDGY